MLRLIWVFLPNIRFYDLIFAYLAFDAGTAAGTASGATSGKQPFFFYACTVPNLCAPPA
jgi:hypothetical protein